MLIKLMNFFLLLCSLGIITVWGLNDVTFFFILFSLILFVMSEQMVSVGGGTADSKTSRGGVSFSKQIAVLDSKRELLNQLLKIRLEALSRVISSPAYRGEVKVDRGARGSQFLEFSFKLVELLEMSWGSRLGYSDLKTTVQFFFPELYLDRYLMSKQLNTRSGRGVLKIIDKKVNRVVFKRVFFDFSFLSDFEYGIKSSKDDLI